MKNEADGSLPAVTQSGAGRVLRAFGDEITLLLEPEQTDGKFVSFLATSPSGGGPPPHFHDAEDEWFYVLEGRFRFFAAGKWTEVTPGGAVFAPRKSVHTFKNIGATPGKMIVQASPSGFEKFFAAAAAEFNKPGGPDSSRIVQIAMDHGIHFVEP